MATSDVYPKVKSVQALANKRLRVEFDNGEARVYDCMPLLDSEVFAPLRNEALFRRVRAEDHGYAVIWNDEIDLAESELWLNGTPVAAEAEFTEDLVARDRKPSD
ncbi:DUF2442 domain-containing protein [candidate division WOR-3 bacterium]|nr:DUF2442 domain-containing protein [candidate division WOR-3 bacterium]